MCFPIRALGAGTGTARFTVGGSGLIPRGRGDEQAHERGGGRRRRHGRAEQIGPLRVPPSGAAVPAVRVSGGTYVTGRRDRGAVAPACDTDARCGGQLPDRERRNQVIVPAAAAMARAIRPIHSQPEGLPESWVDVVAEGAGWAAAGDPLTVKV